ncbi:hypothetical protein V3C99_003271 [Haemonchus contortus]
MCYTSDTQPYDEHLVQPLSIGRGRWLPACGPFTPCRRRRRRRHHPSSSSSSQMSKTDYYSEEKTFSATPYTKPTRAPPISQTKLNARGLKDLDDHDIDGLLSNLSIEELEDLNDDFDPDVSLV